MTIHVIEDKTISTVDGVELRLDTSGRSLEEMLDNAEIVEVGEDGDEIGAYEFGAAASHVQGKVMKIINEELANEQE
jgi:hypothetical protein